MYKIMWLYENKNLENFKGKIIAVLDKEYTGYPYMIWGIRCLVEVEKEEYE